jgi:hypothetical protein
MFTGHDKNKMIYVLDADADQNNSSSRIDVFTLHGRRITQHDSITRRRGISWKLLVFLEQDF